VAVYFNARRDDLVRAILEPSCLPVFLFHSQPSSRWLAVLSEFPPLRCWRLRRTGAASIELFMSELGSGVTFPAGSTPLDAAQWRLLGALALAGPVGISAYSHLAAAVGVRESPSRAFSTTTLRPVLAPMVQAG